MKEKCCAILGGLCLAAVVPACLSLQQGSTECRLGIAVCLLLFAALGMGLLKREKTGGRRLLSMLLPIGAAVLIRCLLLDQVSSDYKEFLAPWLEYFRLHGGVFALKDSVGNYNVPYLYFLALLSYLPAPGLYLTKLLSVFFDFILAWGGFRLVRAMDGEGQDGPAPLAAFSLLLLSPLVVLNSACWGQCDAIYGAFALHALAFLAEEKSKPSVAMIALAFSFKLQAVFLLPLWGVAWLSKKVRFRELWIFPGVYLLTCLPAVLLGRPWADVLTIYLSQAGTYQKVTLEAPNLFQFLPYGTLGSETVLDTVGLCVAAVLVLAVLVLGARLGSRLDREGLLALGLLLATALPYVLPYMHERYFFLAETTALCLACLHPGWIPPAAMIPLAASGGYYYVLRHSGHHLFPLRTSSGAAYAMPIEAGLMTLAVIWVLVLAVREINRCHTVQTEGPAAKL